MSAVLDRSELFGSQVPRIRVIPDGVDHPLWPEVEDFVARLGLDLDEWQWDVLRVSLMRTPDLARWAAFTVAVCAPRQNGKNGILEPRELAGALVLGEQLLIHTAHLADTSKEAFRRMDELIDANAWLSAQVKHIWRTNGHESIEFVNGSRIRYRTRTRGGGRGFSGSPVFFDEPMFLPEVSMGSILPVMSAQPDPQAWYTGSAVDQTIHEDGIVFARVRNRALAGDDARLAYWEWSLDFENPEMVDRHVMRDPAAAAATNPAYGYRISPEYVEAERRELDARTLAVERYGVGDWPSTEGAETIIPLDLWRGLADPESAYGVAPVFAFDVSPARSSASISVAGRRRDGLSHIEVVARGEGTGWVAARLAALVEKHRPREVVFDDQSPAKALLPELKDLGVRARGIDTAELAAACGVFYDAVTQRKLRHRSEAELDSALESAIKGAAQRSIGERWAWSRRRSQVDITPLVACTLAFWASTSQPHYQSAGWN